MDIEFGEASIIPLSSVRPPHEDFGYAAVDLPLAELAGTAARRHLVFAPGLVARTSTTGEPTAAS